MGLDGFSIANLGLNLNKTSANMAREADRLALDSTDDQIKSMDGITKKQKSQKKDKDSSFNKMSYIPGFFEDGEGPEEGEGEGYAEAAALIESPVTSITKTFDIDDEDCANYRFRMNKEMHIEIFDAHTNNILRVINAEDAAKVLMNIAHAPSVIINEEV